MAARRPAAQVRPARPAPVCESCGADVWWAWSLHSKVWVALAPEPYPIDSMAGSHEAWRDGHGGLLVRFLPPGERGEMDRSFRAVLHSTVCGSWARDVTAALVREVRAAAPAFSDGDLTVLATRLGDLNEAITTEMRQRELA